MPDVSPRSALPADAELQAHVAVVAAGLNDRFAELTTDMRDLLAARISELQGDTAIIDLLESSVAGNIENILHSLRHWIPVENIEPPSAAVEYARRLSQRGIPVNALVRAYRLGQQFLLKEAYAEAVRQLADPTARECAYEQIVTLTFDYIDWISQRVVTVYETEREEWLAERNTARFGRVEALLSGAASDVDNSEPIIGYRLRGRHLGLVLWVDDSGAQQDQLTRFNRAAAAIADHLCATGLLVVSRDQSTAWAWIAVPEAVEAVPPIPASILDHASGPPLPMIAIGRPHGGLAGFRHTHREALQAQRVAMIRDDPQHAVTAFDEPGLTVAALLAQDVDQTRWWVRETLGDLALDDEQNRRLRDTLLLFFRNDSSYTATADAIVMHKNSVKYRIASAEKAMGRPVGQDRQAIELALTACHWLGPAVLRTQ
ncbi:PucR family transcriptional regulator [Flexivirga caeni]|uniref:PucR family transcriptional regulator n=1 Tax=Flexivirga caeni TaxID=2294115 RepID=A0A3M9M0M4_9MICO|nr:helix-turn-helix domain-containing protein [Flexivirga caeni]RNI18982.1 PucR family transcriptional regulator [Flexivirga caeni]